MRINLFVLITLLGSLCSLSDVSLAEDSRIGRGEIRLMATRPTQNPFEIGRQIEVPLSIAYRDLPPRSRIYAHLIPVTEKGWTLAGGGNLTAEKPTLNYSGTFVDKNQGYFQFAPSNYPISMLIKKDQLALIFGKLLGKKEAGTEFAEAVSGDMEGYALSLAFLASVKDGDEGIENVTLRFTVPNYPQYYNGIVIAPFVLVYNSDGSQTVYFNGKNMTYVRIPVLPNRPPDVEKTAKKKSPSHGDLPGIATISRYLPSNAVLITGTANSLELTIAYEKLRPKTIIYVAPVPMLEDKVILGQYSMSLTGIQISAKPEFLKELPSPMFRIPAEHEPISVPFIGGEQLEAAFVATVKGGGDGQVKGTVTFSPPAYSRRYQHIYLMPILIVPTDDGNYMLIDNNRLIGIKILVSEG